jgi:hypothetical protein
MQRLLGLAMFLTRWRCRAALVVSFTQLGFSQLIGLSGGMITVMFFAIWRAGRSAISADSGRGADARRARVGRGTPLRSARSPAHAPSLTGALRVPVAYCAARPVPDEPF